MSTMYFFPSKLQQNPSSSSEEVEHVKNLRRTTDDDVGRTTYYDKSFREGELKCSSN